jgi:BirA family biotin operon repressor/biotin-[acetyl-CoA-carboxylase] ligase
VRLVTFDTIGSTNVEALACARRGERGPLWIVAERQTAGRGRHGRLWLSEPGNLSATLLLTEPAPPARAPQLAFVAGLAAHDAVIAAAPALRPRLMLKWPNDLLCDGAKLAGVLIEGEGAAVAIGIGINCRHHPADTAYPATDLAACGASVSPDDALSALSRVLLARLAQWGQGRGFVSIRRDWLARAQPPGTAIRVRIGESELAGTIEGVDEHGRLLLRSADGAVDAVAAGDVFPLVPAAPASD